jgi:hypothetical protein
MPRPISLRTQNKIVKDANDYLELEISERWKIVSVKNTSMNTRFKYRNGALLDNGQIIGLKMTRYAYPGSGKKTILRLREKFKEFEDNANHFNSETQERSKSDAGGLELNLIPEEIETVVPWVLDNYIEVKTIPEWLDTEYLHRIKIGQPMFFYLWTKSASKVYDETRF